MSPDINRDEVAILNKILFISFIGSLLFIEVDTLYLKNTADRHDLWYGPVKN